MYDRDDSAPALLSFLIGGLVGASLTVLFAPDSGPATRRRLRQGLGDTARRGREAARRTMGRSSLPEPGLPTDMGRSPRG